MIEYVAPPVRGRRLIVYSTASSGRSAPWAASSSSFRCCPSCWYDWATQGLFYLCGLLAIATRRRGVVIACLAVLVVLDLLDPVESVIWPS
jgi:hypothetical protein